MLEFINIPNKNPRAKKKNWKVQEDMNTLGVVEWWEPVKEYMFYPNGYTRLDINNLRELSDFIEKQNG